MVIAYALSCSRSLVEEYLRIDRELVSNAEDEDEA